MWFTPCVCIWSSVSLCISDHPWTCDPPASDSWMLGLQVRPPHTHEVHVSVWCYTMGETTTQSQWVWNLLRSAIRDSYLLCACRSMKPPGGESSNIFGSPEEAVPSNRPNRMASNIFGTNEEPQNIPKRTNPPGTGLCNSRSLVSTWSLFCRSFENMFYFFCLLFWDRSHYVA
jgi:hypothetical protein